MIGSNNKVAMGCVLVLLSMLPSVRSATVEPGRLMLRGHVPATVARLTPLGRLPASNNLYLTIGLPLRNQVALDELLRQVYDPLSTNYHKFLTPPEFTARFGPTEQDYQAVLEFAKSNGLRVAETHPNRVVVDVEGNSSDVERAFHVTLHSYKRPTEAGDFFSPDSEPSVPTNLSVVTAEGLSNYRLPKPLLKKIDPLTIRSLGGSSPGGYYAGNDFRNAYVPGTTLNGAGQSVGLLEFSAYYPADVTNYENAIGLTNYVPLNTVVIGHSAPSTANNAEVALDIEVAIALAPGLSRVIVYETGSGPSSILSRMANDNLARQLSSSWSWSGGPSATIDSIFQQMAAQGQSFFQSSGDNDAYTGGETLDNSSQSTAPVDSPNVTCVGGASLTMNGSGGSYASERVWNFDGFGGSYAGVGSGGGISAYYAIPYWQTNISMAGNSGSTTFRNVPDVAMTGDSVYVAYNNGSSGGFAGTSCAAPLWAGFCALVNQQSLAAGGTAVGFLNPALYAIAGSGNYANCFHDITTGNNIGTNTPGLFNAVAGYDLCTGLGTPNGTNLINALAPPAAPFFLTQPLSRTVTGGTNFILSATVGGRLPFGYKWLLNGTNLPAGGNVSGTTSNVLTIVAATTNNSGAYQIIVTNIYGSATSAVAVVSVGYAPAFSTQPPDLTVLSGSTAVFSATLSGSSPLNCQWRQNGTNLVNGTGVSGATADSLALTAVTTNNNGDYSLFVTNNFGAITSSGAALIVVFPPSISGSLTDQTIECGSNIAFAVAASGTPPLSFQWSLDGTPVPRGTNATLSLTNVHLPNHTVTLVVTNPYASVSSNAVVTVHDTRAPVILLSGGNPSYLELGSTFTDPGATASDVCAGMVPVVASGAVNTNAVGTNTLVYTASDGNGNTGTVTRTVIVRDTTPPTIVWSFTNLTLAADANCRASMPDVTGTNFILATDFSGPTTIVQNPTNNSALPLGTNLMVISVSDTSGNTVSVTNTITVRDQTPPLILSQPLGQTNVVGTTVILAVGASACTPLEYQWFFNGDALTNQTNNTLKIVSVSPANAGTYSATVTATGGSTNSAAATLTVFLQASTVALGSSANPSGYLDDLHFTATIAPVNATGTVQFVANGSAFDAETFDAGQCVSTNLASLSRGTNLIAAVYSGDANHLPVTNTLVQIVTNHPPTAAAAFYNRFAGSTLSIAIADLATNWADVDGDALSLAAVGVSTNGVTLTNNAGTLVYFGSTDVADQFVCTISDGWGGTNVQTINIAVTPAFNATPSITGAASNPGGSFSLDLTGAPGYTYILETTTNLISPANWLPIATNVLGTNGLWQFNDMQAVTLQQRFYRLKLAP